MVGAKRLAHALMKANREDKRPWRKISLEDFGGEIPAGTLNRIAKSGGAWLPKDRRMLKLLGLKRAPADLFDMSTAALASALAHRHVMPPIDPRIIDLFVSLGWMRSVDG